MRTVRVFCHAPLQVDCEFELDQRATHHLLRVLRRRVGDAIELFDGSGVQARAELTVASRRDGCRVRVIEAARVDRESPLSIVLVQALARGEKMDWIIQKAVELGASEIRPIVSQRCDVRPDPARTERQRARWREIVINACEQSGRNLVMPVAPPVILDELQIESRDRYYLHPEAGSGLGQANLSSSRVAIAIGPEGGWSDQDLQVLRRLEFKPASLGPRVLRSETAGMTALAVLQSLGGDFSG
ncbi:MAG: 16S rRNA (uracil(1498)-N(3))-methyltransferase [Xanthomonadaceae bacterium]|nr:16S rRNA (uracil(1498)-N(3))-methyltransferase [Xanthomonadaceae bacterium]